MDEAYECFFTHYMIILAAVISRLPPSSPALTSLNLEGVSASVSDLPSRQDSFCRGCSCPQYRTEIQAGEADSSDKLSDACIT